MCSESETIEERKRADRIFLLNMIKRITYKSMFDPYKWKRIKRLRLKIAVVYFRAVSWYTREVVFKV